MRIPRSIGILLITTLLGCASPYRHPENLDDYQRRSSNGGVDAALSLRDDLYFAYEVLRNGPEMNIFGNYFMAAELMVNNRTGETILISHENVSLILEPGCANLRFIGADEAKKHLYGFPAYLFVSGVYPAPWEVPVVLVFGVAFSPLLYWDHKSTEDTFDEYYFQFGDIPPGEQRRGFLYLEGIDKFQRMDCLKESPARFKVSTVKRSGSETVHLLDPPSTGKAGENAPQSTSATPNDL